MYKEPYGYGAYTIEDINNLNTNQVFLEPGVWVPARPIPYTGIIDRIVQAYDVLISNADALYWGKRKK